jgi:hypothetical protein
MAFRGFHICWFPENTPVQIERYIRLAAYYKMKRNRAGIVGHVRVGETSRNGVPYSTMTVKEVKRWSKIADGLGVTLIPQINLFGHASGSRAVRGSTRRWTFTRTSAAVRAAGLDVVSEQSGDGQLLEEQALEMHDAFGRPPYFHAGCDEADEMGTL